MTDQNVADTLMVLACVLLMVCAIGVFSFPPINIGFIVALASAGAAIFIAVGMAVVAVNSYPRPDPPAGYRENKLQSFARGAMALSGVLVILTVGQCHAGGRDDSIGSRLALMSFTLLPAVIAGCILFICALNKQAWPKRQANERE